MGINLIVKKIVSRDMEETLSGNLVPYYRAEEQKWFDTCRFSGDKDFVQHVEFDGVDEAGEFRRPKELKTICI